MKKLIMILLVMILATSCVQKSYVQTLILILDVSRVKEKINTVGVRGENEPLSWQNDTILEPIIKDSLYTVNIKMTTGYTFTEIKFVVNGNFELKDQPNRRINFNQNRVTNYKAKFNIQ